MEWSGGLWRGGSDAVGRAAIGASERPVAAGFGSASFERKTRKGMKRGRWWGRVTYIFGSSVA